MTDTRTPRLHRRLRTLRDHRQQGMTLVEIMIVVVIMALIATAVAVAVLPARERANVRATQSDVSTVRNAAENYILENTGDCPTVENLVGEYLNSRARSEDAWGNAFQIECSGNEVIVRSAGPDGNMGTEDDIE